MCLMLVLTTLDASMFSPASGSMRLRALNTRALVMTVRSNVYAYTWALDEGKTTLDALHEYGRWDQYTHSVMVTLIIWTADFLTVRTYDRILPRETLK